MNKIIFLSIFMIGFWVGNAQNQLTRKRWEGRSLETANPAEQHQQNYLRNINTNIVMSENFDNVTLPAGWTVVDNTGNGDWTFVTDYNGNTLDGTPFAMIDSDNYGQVDIDTELISPEIDVSTLNYIFISFDHFFDAYISDALTEIGDVDVYDGTQWVNVYSVDTDTGDWGNPDHQIIDVTAYKNANFKVRFHYYNANYEWYWAIDNVQIFETYSNDLAVTSISHALIPGIPYNLTARVFNAGYNTQNDFDVTFNIVDSSNNVVFNETVNITGASLSSFNFMTVSTTSQITLSPGAYSYEVTVTLNGDEDTSNNTFQNSFDDLTSTYNSNTMYSYITFDGDSSGDENNLINLDINTGTPTIIGPANSTDFLASGTFINDVLVAVDYTSLNLYLINGSTGTTYLYGTLSGDINSGDNFTSIAYNQNTQSAYVTDDYNLYSLNLQNLNTTLIGPFNISAPMVGLDIDNNGNMYGICLDDNLYSVDPATGATTLIGPLGMDINYAQDIGFDPVSGILYGTLYRKNNNNNDYKGGLYVIDTTTGAATAIGTPGDDEYSICAMSGNTVSVSENKIAGLKVYPNPSNGMIWIGAGENIHNISVFNLTGQKIKNFKNDDLTAQLDISDLPSGSYILKISTGKITTSYQIIKR